MTQCIVHALLDDGRRIRVRIQDERIGHAIHVRDLSYIRGMVAVAANKRGWGINPHNVAEVQFEVVDQPPAGDPVGERSRTKGCRAALGLAHRVLPARVRDDALDEWLDEIECAAAAGSPVVRRTLSIILRTLPSQAWRARIPVRARGKGG